MYFGYRKSADALTKLRIGIFSHWFALCVVDLHAERRLSLGVRGVIPDGDLTLDYSKNWETAPTADHDVTRCSKSEPPAQHSVLAARDRREIRERAYRYWEESDRFAGARDEHWFRAEPKIRDRSNSIV